MNRQEKKEETKRRGQDASSRFLKLILPGLVIGGFSLGSFVDSLGKERNRKTGRRVKTVWQRAARFVRLWIGEGAW